MYQKILISQDSFIVIPNWGSGHFGGSDEDRTRYLLHAMEALSQVSYRPDCLNIIDKNEYLCNYFSTKKATEVAILLFHLSTSLFFSINNETKYSTDKGDCVDHHTEDDVCNKKR